MPGMNRKSVGVTPTKVRILYLPPHLRGQFREATSPGRGIVSQAGEAPAYLDGSSAAAASRGVRAATRHERLAADLSAYWVPGGRVS